MAGDWIKLRKCVLTHPRLVRTMSALKADKLRTLGGLVSAWCLFDEQTTDGELAGYTPEILDEMVGFPGLASAMAEAGWLVITKTGLQAPEFEKHNGATAKRRAQDSVRKMSARKADKCPARRGQKPEQEKRREEKNKIKAPQLPDEEWLASLAADPAFSHININAELQNAQKWIQKQNGRRVFTRRFFEGWLKRTEKPVAINGHDTRKPSEKY